MFNFLKRKEKIQFTPLYRAAQFDAPIIPASKYKRDWVDIQKKVYQNLKNNNINRERITSTHKCPGLTAHFTRGFIVSAHRDIPIYTKGDITEPEYVPCKLDYSTSFWTQNIDNEKDISFFGGSMLKGIQRPYPEKTPNIIFKIMMPWLVRAPDNIIFLISSIPFANTVENFTVIGGILDTQLSHSLQALLWVHEHNNKLFCIKKGTPLFQLIPISRVDFCKEYEIVNDEETFKQEVAETLTLGYIQNSTLQSNYTNIRNVSTKYSKLYDKKKKCPFSFLFKK